MMASPFRSAHDLLADFNRLHRIFEQALHPEASADIRAMAGAGFPVINVGSTPDTVEVMALAPGVDPSQLEITIDRGVLIIAGTRQATAERQTSGLTLHASERFQGPFRRVLSLPDDVDAGKVDAHYRDGVLRITLHKRESSKPRRIAVQ